MITFPKTAVSGFRHDNPNLRWGQAFHQHMKLEKVVQAQDKEFCDTLYNADDVTAKVLVAARMDAYN